MKDRITPEFIHRIPKSDLHLHLDGSLRLKTLIELARQEKVKLPSTSESGMRKLVFKDTYRDLPEYLHGFAYTCAVLRRPENLERVARELVEDNAAEGVRYIEVRFAPQLHVCDGMSATDAVRAVAKGYPPEDHKEAYQYAHDHFIRKTVHAGEAYGPESIWQAITQCHANRIGHGTFLFAHEMIKAQDIPDHRRYVEDLASYIASQRIGIEACVTSNLQTTPNIKTISAHPIKKMIDYGLSVSICTDNRLVSNTTVSRELELVTRHVGLTRHQLRNLVIAGFKGSFFPGSYNAKREFVAAVVAHYRRIETELLG
jgi:adenosine deaminase